MKTNNKKTLKLQDINNIKNKTKKKRINKSNTPKINSNANTMDATMEPKETYFEMAKTIKKTQILTMAACGCNANTIPKVVATPFPPLKSQKTGSR